MQRLNARASEGFGVLKNFGAFIMKLLFLAAVLALSACATNAPPRPHAPDGVSASPAIPFTLTISGDELKQTGRAELSDALRAASPIFH
jgi:hypothetical protein